MNEFEDIINNPSGRKTLTEIENPRRRHWLIAAAVSSLFMHHEVRAANKSPFQFESVPYSRANDEIQLPPGYQWSVLAAWGDPINGQTPRMKVDVSDGVTEQNQQFGMHHDGGSYFPSIQRPNEEGLWVVNHEYTDDGLLHPGGMNQWSEAKVNKSKAAHGVSICAIQKQTNQQWAVINDPRSRRITANTPCIVAGPAAGHPLMKTQADPSGKWILGTLNNCAHGKTPWGTYLTCEENFNGYFTKQNPPTKEETRVGLNKKGFGYRWEEFDSRFNSDLHPNEINRFGWVVEIDPQNPKSHPIKRTALGRFKHEGAWVTVAKNGQVVIYMGDDQRNEYIYKYVSKGKYQAQAGLSNSELLNQGTLYVARFDADGKGRWIALEHNRNGLTSENGFPDQAYILIHTRLAADQVGATPMDRPEWIAVNPKNQDVYVTLTNNSERGKSITPSASNPRANNLMGHIVRWQETRQDAASTTFTWNIYALAGDRQSENADWRGNIMGDQLGSPDGLWFDPRGILWTQTDISTSTLGKGAYLNMPNNAMYASDPQTREFRRFLIGPKGCEITGVDLTPDLRTMFVNIQHPGESPSERANPDSPKAVSSWPDHDSFSRPRSATIAIWRQDGKVIGS